MKPDPAVEIETGVRAGRFTLLSNAEFGMTAGSMENHRHLIAGSGLRQEESRIHLRCFFILSSGTRRRRAESKPGLRSIFSPLHQDRGWHPNLLR